MRHMHQCARYNADIAMRSSRCVQTMFCENNPKCCRPAFAAAALCDMPGESEPADVGHGHVAHSGIGQQLLGRNVEKLECEYKQCGLSFISIHFVLTVCGGAGTNRCRERPERATSASRSRQASTR